MCDTSCLDFGRQELKGDDVAGKFVLEVGAMDVNGSLRSIAMQYQPARYVGVDIAAGPGVDEVCPAEALEQRFGADAADVVISTEMLEHVFDWRRVIHNLKAVLKPGGVLLLTTRSKGFPLHGYPSDWWRFEIEDFQAIFRDLQVEALVKDWSGGPGVFVLARKSAAYVEADLGSHALYSVVSRERTTSLEFSPRQRFWFGIRLWLSTQLINLVLGARRVGWRVAYVLSRVVPQPVRQKLWQRLFG